VLLQRLQRWLSLILRGQTPVLNLDGLICFISKAYIEGSL
jgi:hypothetical protein